MTDDLHSVESQLMIDAHVQYRCRPRLSPHPIERAVSCYQRSAKGGNTPAWEWNSCWTGVKKLKVSFAGGSISHLFSVFFNKIPDPPAGTHFLYESEWQSHSDHSRGTTDTKMLRVLFLKHMIYDIFQFFLKSWRSGTCVCVCDSTFPIFHQLIAHWCWFWQT